MVADNTTQAVARPRGGFQAPVPDEVLAVPDETAAAYARHIERTGLAPTSVRAYTSQVARFAKWLDGDDRHDPVDAFTDPFSRDYAVRDYRAYLLDERGLKASSIDAALAATDSFYVWLGLGKAQVTRTKQRNSEQFGEGLSDEQVKAVMRAAERRTRPDRRGNPTDPFGVRDLAIMGLFLLAGPRLSELAGVKVNDWHAGERSGSIEFRGKGSKVRTVPLPSKLRPLMIEWRTERAQLGLPHDFAPFFVSRQGGALASRSIAHTVGVIGKEASVPELHPHMLRHTFAIKRLEAGDTVAEVQALLGHASIETTQIYTKPTAAQVSERADAWKVEW